MSTESSAELPLFPLRRVLFRALRFVAVLAALLLLASTIVFVDETEAVIFERLGKVQAVYDHPGEAGLHFKWPWPMETVRRFDRRTQLFDPPARETFTSDRKSVTVDLFVAWRIASDPHNSALEARPEDRPVVKFFRALGHPDVAESRIDSRLRSLVSSVIGGKTLAQLLTAESSQSGPAPNNPPPLSEVSQQLREQLVADMHADIASGYSWGIEIIDVRIHRVNFPTANQQAVFERMRSERQRAADSYRSSGQAENTAIRSAADRQSEEILAKAQSEASRIRAEADAQALKVLNQAHSRDPELARIIQTLDAYQEILTERTTLVLSASSSLLRLLNEGVENLPPNDLPRANPPLATEDPKSSPPPKSSAPTVPSRSGP